MPSTTLLCSKLYREFQILCSIRVLLPHPHLSINQFMKNKKRNSKLLSPEQALLTALEELLKVFRSPNPRLLLVLQPEQFPAKSVRLKLQLQLERVDHLERAWSSLWVA
jgi:hypothetical protein